MWCNQSKKLVVISVGISFNSKMYRPFKYNSDTVYSIFLSSVSCSSLTVSLLSHTYCWFFVAVANRTVDQANIVADTAVAGANEVSQATVEGVENIAATTGMASQAGYRRDKSEL